MDIDTLVRISRCQECGQAIGEGLGRYYHTGPLRDQHTHAECMPD